MNAKYKNRFQKFISCSFRPYKYFNGFMNKWNRNYLVNKLTHEISALSNEFVFSAGVATLRGGFDSSSFYPGSFQGSSYFWTVMKDS